MESNKTRQPVRWKKVVVVGPESPDRAEKHLRLISGLPEEAVVVCPSCKTIETVLVRGDGNLVPTRKFHQTDRRIYHDCGATEPCRLVRG